MTARAPSRSSVVAVLMQSLGICKCYASMPTLGVVGRERRSRRSTPGLAPPATAREAMATRMRVARLLTVFPSAQNSPSAQRVLRSLMQFTGHGSNAAAWAVEALVLEGVGVGVGVELVVEADAAALLAEVEQDAAAVGDSLDRLAQLRATVAAGRAEDVAGVCFSGAAVAGCWPRDGPTPSPGWPIVLGRLVRERG